MSIGGAAGYFEFFREDLIPDALELVLDAWNQMPSPQPSDKEDAMTATLAERMKRMKKARSLPFSIHFQVIPLGASGAIAARIDFNLQHGNDEDSALVFECKRLRIPRPSGIDHNTGSYVGGEGMERFASGKYAPTQHHGVMIAYVMDGQVLAAMNSVIAAVLASANLGTKSKTWDASRFLPGRPNVAETRHSFTTRAGGSSRCFVFQHVFLTV